MIIGVGQDICDVERIDSTITNFGTRFIKRIFTENEKTKCESNKNRVDCYAKRFAAKEACSKALGTGFRMGVFYKDIEIKNLPSGKPTIKLHNGALNRLKNLCPENYLPQIELSISDDKKLALAMVIITAQRIKKGKVV